MANLPSKCDLKYTKFTHNAKIYSNKETVARGIELS